MKTLSKNLSNLQSFCQQNDPYNHSVDQNARFISAMQEVIAWHIENNSFYKKLTENFSYDKDQLKTIEDIATIPFIMANFFKVHELVSIPKEDVYLHLTSSGTTGQKSQMFFDQWTITIAQEMVDKIFEYYGWITPQQKCNYLLYTYGPEEGSKVGTAYTDNFLCKYAPINKVFYALKYAGKEDGQKFDLFGTLQTFQEYEKEKLPVRIFGFPAFFYFTLKKMKELHFPKIQLHPQSLVFLGGGWKGNQDKAISKEEMYSLIHELLGIPDERIRDGFGSVEHCVPYIECSRHQFHIPTWSRIVIRDILNLQPLPYGQVGYLNFISPYITSAPAHSVLMGDLASLHSPVECSCGLTTPFFKITGRAGISQNKSCAIAASEILNKW